MSISRLGLGRRSSSIGDRCLTRGTQVSESRENGLQIDAADELHDDVVITILLPDTEQRHDVGVMQPCCGPSFALKCTALSGTLLWENLHCDMATQGFMECFVNDSHTAAPDFTQQAEFTQPFELGGTQGSA
jgi:hypothetical protein